MGADPSAAALFYSLIASTNHVGTEPRACLREATLGTVRGPGTVALTRDLESAEFREKTAG